MKRWLTFFLAVVCLLFAVGCESPEQSPEQVPEESSRVYFIGEVTYVSESSLMVDVTDAGDCGLTVGTPASVSLRNVPTTSSAYRVGDLVRVVFNGMVQESYPVGIPTVYSVDKV